MALCTALPTVSSGYIRYATSIIQTAATAKYMQTELTQWFL